MRNILFSSLFILSFAPVVTKAQKEVNSTIKQVTVYQSGSQVTRKANVRLDKGVTELQFKALPVGISAESIQASAGDAVTIVSVTHGVDYLNKQVASKEIMLLENRRELLTDSVSILKNQQRVLLQEKEMVLANKTIAGEEGVKALELEKMATFFRTRLNDIETRTYQLGVKVKSIQRELISVSQQMLELNAQIDKPTSLVRVKVSCNAPIATDMELRYFIADAGWKATYDVRIDDISNPMSLFYKAQVYQNTGEDWKDVLLTLSTGNPSISNNKPELLPYLLTFNNYYTTRSAIENAQPFSGSVSGRVFDESGEPIPGATVVVKGTNIGVVTDINGSYKLNVPQQNSLLVVSFIGHKPQEVYANAPVQNIRLEQDNVMLEEVVVTGYGSGSHSPMRLRAAAPAAPVAKVNIPLAIEKTQVATEFKIEMPYSIPADNQPYDVSVLEYQIPAEYRYASVPKLSPDAFLVAQIPNWSMYELLDGDANLFFRGIYQGKTYLDLQRIEDTLALSVGRDRDIQVKRESKKDFARKSLVGSSRREQRVWEITIKNNKPHPVSITIEDQFPVSKEGEIKVEQVEALGAKIDEADGKVKWLLTMPAGESRTLLLKYTVRYPQGRKVIVE